jgi:hypothetical protein
VQPWVLATTVALTGLAAACLAVCLRRTPPRWAATVALALGAAALLVGAAWASGTAVANGLGPFDSPYQSQALTSSEQAGWQHDVAAWPALAAHAASVPKGRSIETAETSAEVSQDVLATGREYLPVGGFSGQVPSTPLNQFVRDVHDGRIVDVLVAVRPPTRNPDMRWVLSHCSPAPAVGTSSKTSFVTNGRQYRSYVCG